MALIRATLVYFLLFGSNNVFSNDELGIQSVTSSPNYQVKSDGTVGDPDPRVIDNDASTRWAHSESGAKLKFVLDTLSEVSSFEIGFYRGHKRKYSFDVEFFDENGTSVKQSFQSNENNTETFTLTQPVLAKTIIITGYGNLTRRKGGNYKENRWNSYHEVDFFGSAALPDLPFITTWDPSLNWCFYQCTTNGITFHVKGEGVIIDWGDGNVEGPSDFAELTHVQHIYADPSKMYDVSIYGLTQFATETYQGSFPKDAGELITVKQWGDAQWESMRAMFHRTHNFVDIEATDLPDLSQVTDMSTMFLYAHKFVGSKNIADWDVSNVTNMRTMFENANVFNGPIGNWDVSSVENMGYMFAISSFNQDITNWNTSSVTNMQGMFDENDSFDQNLGNWDFSNVSLVSAMFKYATLSSENYNALLIKFVETLGYGSGIAPGLYNVERFDGGYSIPTGEGITARDTLINDYGWDIRDGI